MRLKSLSKGQCICDGNPCDRELNPAVMFAAVFFFNTGKCLLGQGCLPEQICDAIYGNQSEVRRVTF